ncbi:MULTISPECIES: porin family protein [Chryseobacterium]|uniref:Outer membrane immunogenic protein n=1 Tax=Chryseobacterium camelliae TaxID=1265445 RepID=A0ABU0TH34_9FLAO|nr:MULTISPECIES: porin family protein [Chryseobacterium]MDT3405919.1 outer membrane immunogenic protein [Pseudacidovorax intermedius]MDQ1096276.1 outer membrane immunogenic protein [Chryseobacterium camelliae]MDQ1100213.1 outer membrane immunogenic protein [Chryseobacterium sp. SORGH_AS_1048]MDR6087558.1 outer membrane immunogenic protein [Chryseobacterium sp. SORGH_AS_0909]MDR6131932.1 outer membrane immunogenic protein [Chryseobacterium sp. SORGH_AS_1175]
MKKLILGLAITAGSLAFAQTTSTSSTGSATFGIKAGMNVSSLSDGADLSDSKSKIGFNAGVFANIPLASSFSLQPEVIYNDLGSKVTREGNVLGNTYKAEYSRNLGYIAVPVMFQYNATPEFYLEAGPEFGFLVSAKDKMKSTVNNSSNTQFASLNKNDFQTFNFGIGIGAGYYFIPNLGVTLRYTAGLTDIYKNNNGDSVKNNVFQVGLAYKF